MLNKCPDAGQPSPMQRRFCEFHYDCLRQVEAWKQYKTPEPETPKEITNDQEAQLQVEESTLMKENLKAKNCEEES